MPNINDEFDWDAYYRDTRVLSPDARGAWLDCLYHQRLSPTRGRISLPLQSFSTIFGTTARVTKRILSEISSLGVGEVSEDNGKITVINRRMFRQWQEQEGNKDRQSAYRARHSEVKSNGKITDDDEKKSNGDVTSTPETRVVVEEYKEKKEELKQQRRKVVTFRIPDPFPLTDQMIEWAKTNCPGLRIIEAHENFIEYWTNCAGARAEKVDWNLTWKKGMKLALGWQKKADLYGTNRQHNPGGKPTSTDRIGEHQAVIDQYPSETDPDNIP